MNNPLVLSLFPGIGLFDHAFTLEGFTVVRGPDLLWGADIHSFHPPFGRFNGVIGGPPCQRFSPIGNVNRARWGDESVMPDLTPEFERLLDETGPAWWVMENSTYCPGPARRCYRVSLNNADLGERQRRWRSFWSNLDLQVVIPDSTPPDAGTERAVSSKGSVDWKGSRAREPKRTLEDCCELQGLLRTYFDHSPFRRADAMKMIGNAVPIAMGRAIARAVRSAMEHNTQ